tara:strand:+ start:2401 stop:3147 length:747 start_codon:yes stop_codon:yes gene_type:complete
MNYDKMPSAFKMLLDAYTHASVPAAEMFSQWDTSGDGLLSQNELRKVLKKGCGMDLSEDDFFHLWRFLDADGSGEVSCEELEAVVEQGARLIDAQAKARAAAEKAAFMADMRQRQVKRAQGRVYGPDARMALFEVLGDARIQPKHVRLPAIDVTVRSTYHAVGGSRARRLASAAKAQASSPPAFQRSNFLGSAIRHSRSETELLEASPISYIIRSTEGGLSKSSSVPVLPSISKQILSPLGRRPQAVY